MIWAYHFENTEPHVQALYEIVVRAIKKIGPVTIIPEKPRIAFQVRMSFAQITPRRKWLDGHVVLARRLESARFSRIDTISPRNHVHVGQQRHLRAPPTAGG